MSSEIRLLQKQIIHDNMDHGNVTISREEIKRLHDMALGLAQLCRRYLGLDPLMTGKQQRREFTR